MDMLFSIEEIIFIVIIDPFPRQNRFDCSANVAGTKAKPGLWKKYNKTA
jgi:hypothetical protein